VDETPDDHQDWAAVADVITARLRRLRMSKAELARETGLSETTIRYLGRSPNPHYKPALLAISVMLRWRHDYLLNVLHGRPEKNVQVTPPLLAAVERLVHAEASQLRSELSELLETARAMNNMIDLLLAHHGVTVSGAREG
jgi:lambda repressor-like predicted transcriptional regulator